MNPATAALCVLSLGIGLAIGYLAGPRIGADDGPTPSLATALDEEDLLIRSQLLGQFLETLGPENLEQSLETLHAKRVGMTDQELRVFMLAWGRFDAAGAFSWARAQDTDWSNRLEKAAVFAWGFRDPRGALAELETLPESAEKSGRRGKKQESPSLGDDLISGWRVNGDVAGLTAHLISMPASREREKITNNFLAQLGKEGPEAIIAWTDAIPEDAEGGFKRLAFNRAAGAIAQTDVRMATRWYEAHRGKDYTERALSVIARRWIDFHEPVELFTWLADLPPLPGKDFDPEQARAIGKGMKWWLRRDPDTAQQWLSTFVVVPAIYDQAIASLSQYLLKQSPEFAVKWADRIQDRELRTETLSKGLGRWRRKDKEAAEEWLATAEVSDGIRNRILNESNRPGNRVRKRKTP
jgi:hypothetical protein